MKDLLLASAVALLCIPLGCGKGDREDTGPAGGTTSDTTTDGGDGDACAGTAYADSPLCTAWMLNTSGETSAVLRDSSGAALPVNVQSLELLSRGGEDFIRVQSAGIPSYVTEVDQDLLDALNSRPNKSTDFVSGAPTISVGEFVDFGQDVGYASNRSCPIGGGYGYWPPGPTCPEDAGHDFEFPLNPRLAAEGEQCVTGLGSQGLFVNGVSVYNWSDGFSYDALGIWQNLAQQFEVYDGGICDGHAAGVDYHHHYAATCLGKQLGDDGSAHSPIYGFAGDGYPIYGPWFANGVRAESCWRTRDYDTSGEPLGCGGGGVRDCLLVDPYDPSLGTTAAEAPGPDTSEVVTSLSGNDFVAVSGFYFQDWYFDPECAETGGEYLDQYNGHDHDGLGYHYHMTGTFPYITGPTLAGVVTDEDVSCGGVTGGPGGGPPP